MVHASLPAFSCLLQFSVPTTPLKNKGALHCKKAPKSAALTQTNYSGISKILPQKFQRFFGLFSQRNVTAVFRLLLVLNYFCYITLLLTAMKKNGAIFKNHEWGLNQWLTSNCLTGLSLCIEIPPILAKCLKRMEIQDLRPADLWARRILKNAKKLPIQTY